MTPTDHPRHKRTALFVYNGSVSGKLSGGEQVYATIRWILRENFEVRELVLDDIIARVPPRLKRIAKRTGLAALVFVSFLLYRRYDLVVTTWTPEVPFCGDVSYIQSYAGLFEEPHSRQHAFESFGKQLLALPMRLLARASLKRQTFVAASAFCHENVSKRFRKDSRIVYPPARLKSKFEVGNREKVVLSIGRISPEKNFDVLAKVGPLVPEAKFLLVGPMAAEDRYIVDKIRRGFAAVKLADRFEYVGWTSEEMKQRLQSSARVFFHPAKNDPFPLVIIEAMNHGAIPVVDSSGGARESARQVYTYDDSSEAAEKIRLALSNWSPSMASELHNASLRYAEHNFCKEFLEILREISERKAGARR